jgi:hypothetical protein
MNDSFMPGAVSDGAVTSDELALLSAYRAMSDHARREVIAAARAGAEQYPRRQPRLTLVSTRAKGGH